MIFVRSVVGKSFVSSRQMVVNLAALNVNISVKMGVMSQMASPEWLLTSKRLLFLQPIDV